MSTRLTILLPVFLIFLLYSSPQCQAQDTSYVRQPTIIVVDSTNDHQTLTTSPDRQSVEPLLPHKMLLTQRLFWGPGGLLRIIGAAPLTAEGRQKEQKVRSFMLVTHQVTGYATLAGFVMQGILGARLNKATGSEYDRLRHVQQITAAITNIAYGTTALLSLTAPPKIRSNQKAATGGVRLHKYLSIIHLTGFVATNILAGKAAQNAEFRPYHQAATFTTLAAFAPALIALKF